MSNDEANEVATADTLVNTVTSTPPGMNSKHRPSASRSRRSALRQFYALDAHKDAAANNLPTSVLDRPNFDADRYINDLLKRSSVKELLRSDNELVQEIRVLEGEKKALVYDNYSKLIAASNSIEQIRKELAPLTQSRDKLMATVERVRELTDQVSQQ